MDERPSRLPPDIDRFERAGSAALGTVLAAAGLARGTPGGYASAAAGALLVARGLTGRCALTRAQKARGVGEVHVKKAVTIMRPPGEIYSLLRHFELLPAFMLHVKSVAPREDGSWHWVAPVGPGTLEWDALVVDDIPGERFEWRSIPGGDVEHAGMVDLVAEPAGKGTEVHVALTYRPPGGIASAPFRGLFSKVTDTLFATELRRLKQLLEAGEIATPAMNGPRATAALVSPASPDILTHAIVGGVLS